MKPEFLVRSVRKEDLSELYRLSKLVYFLNLPADKDILRKKIAISLDSFSEKIEDKFARQYILVLQELSSKKIVGSSMVIARHGSPGSPHMYFEVNEIQKYSETIKKGFTHQVLKLKFEYDGPTEIGGLVIDPTFRGHPNKLGKLLSFSRFLLIRARRRWFKDRILSELMPPLTESGESLLWQALGKKFTNLSYQQADLLSRKNKEFVTSLFPRRDVFVCLLPKGARELIGKVGKETEPVRHMLEKIGFRWKHHIDPFDGGPHFWADTDKISIVHSTQRLGLYPSPGVGSEKNRALVGVFKDNEFFCIQSAASPNKSGLQLPQASWDALRLQRQGETRLLYLPF